MAKHLINNINALVLEELQGLLRSNPALSLIENERVVYRTENRDKVTLISGGGSGHSPAHAGYVGRGMLDAAVAGTIFASPSTKQILAGLRAKHSPRGSLVIVKNYTGDVLHFGLAAERSKAEDNNKVEVVVVQDDVAVGRKQGGLVGRRGLAGTIFVHKIAGAAAENGEALGKVASLARSIIESVATVSASLDHCTVPGRDEVEDLLKPHEIEIGTGIHNEPGFTRRSPIPSTAELTKDLLKLLLDTSDKDRGFLKVNKGDSMVLMINNLGGMSTVELSAFAENVASQLQKDYGIIPKRVYVGSFMTALNGPGASISLLNLSSVEGGVERTLSLLDAPTEAPGWTASVPPEAWKSAGKPNIIKAAEEQKVDIPSKVQVNKELFAKVIDSGCRSVIEQEPLITKYDTVAGDGDCGETLKNGGNAVMGAFKANKIRMNNAANAIADLSALVEDSMGGTSGALYSIYLNGFAQGVRDAGSKSNQFNVELAAEAAAIALQSLSRYTPARVGDRTLMDALVPFVETLQKSKDLAAAVSAAQKGAEGTRKLAAKFGRATYVGAAGLKEENVPDPGAVGFAALVEGFQKAL